MKKIIFLLLILLGHVSYGQDGWKIALEKFDYKGAVLELDKIIANRMSKVPVDSAEVRSLVIQKAKCLKQIMDFEAAYETLATVYEWENGDIVILGEMAECVRLMGNNAEALAIYGILCQISSDNLYFRLQRMMLQYNLGMYEECVENGKGILKKDTLPMVLNCVGNGFNKLKLKDSALCYYGKLYNLTPYDHKVVEKISAILLDRKMYDSVAVLCSNFLKDDPMNVTINGVYGVALHFMKDYKESHNAFDRYLEAGGDTLTAYYYEGLNSIMERNFYVAETCFKKAMEYDSTNVDIVYYAAFATAEIMRFEKSLELYNLAEKMVQPDSMILYKINYGKAEALFRYGKYKSALSQYLKAMKYGGKSKEPLIYSRLGYCYRLMGEYQKAIENYEKYLLSQGEKTEATKSFVEEELKYIREELFMIEK